MVVTNTNERPNVMKILLNRWAGRRAFDSGLRTAATLLLLAALPVAAATSTPYTSTGWIIGVPVPGIWHTNAVGQVLFRGNAHLARVESSDPRLTGQRQILVDGVAQANGSLLLYGNCYHQVGTWDTTGTRFTATGGLWEISYRGVMQTDNSLQLHLVGSGSGGNIEGLRFAEDLTRAACQGILDPGCPYRYAGTIESAPVNATQVVDNFDDNELTGWAWNGAGTTFPLLEANHQFTVRGKWPGLVTRAPIDTWDFPYLGKNWSVANNQTLECRVDLVSMSENATNAAGCVLWNNSAIQSCILSKGRDFVQVGKWVGGEWGGVAVFFHEKAVIKNSNVVLSLALTRVDPNVVLTARVLDKDNQEAVLYQRSVVDTPGIDPTLTSEELLASSGMDLSTYPDNGPPLTSGDGIMLNAFQYTDGQQPELDVTYDNLELRTYEVPLVGIERAVRLSWPASATINYAVEAAPTVQGPWLPIQELPMPGTQQATVPASEFSKVFRLRQAP
jgi:hypothetical protein